MARKDVQEKVHNYILDTYVTDGGELNDKEMFMTSGLVDSTGVLEVVEWLNKEFGVDVENHEMTPNNLGSVEAITDFVLDKQ